jgi:hypothetical protein
MRDEEIKKKIENDPDYIYNPKMGNSLKKMVERYPDGIEDEKIAKVLCMDISEIEEIYEGVLIKIREKLGVEE